MSFMSVRVPSCIKACHYRIDFLFESILFTLQCAIAENIFANIILVALQYPLQDSIFLRR